MVAASHHRLAPGVGTVSYCKENTSGRDSELLWASQRRPVGRSGVYKVTTPCHRKAQRRRGQSYLEPTMFQEGRD